MSAIEKKQRRAPAKDKTLRRGFKAHSEQEAQSDAEWDRAFANSRDALAKLAEKARKEYREGKTEELDPDNL